MKQKTSQSSRKRISRIVGFRENIKREEALHHLLDLRFFSVSVPANNRFYLGRFRLVHRDSSLCSQQKDNPASLKDIFGRGDVFPEKKTFDAEKIGCVEDDPFFKAFVKHEKAIRYANTRRRFDAPEVQHPQNAAAALNNPESESSQSWVDAETA